MALCDAQGNIGLGIQAEVVAMQAGLHILAVLCEEVVSTSAVMTDAVLNVFYVFVHDLVDALLLI